MAEPLRFHREGDCFWLTLPPGAADLNGSPEMVRLQSELETSGAGNLIVDLSKTPFFGSLVLEFLVHLWRRISKNGGKMVIYKPSMVGREVLAASRLDRLWTMVETREAALQVATDSIPEQPPS